MANFSDLGNKPDSNELSTMLEKQIAKESLISSKLTFFSCRMGHEGNYSNLFCHETQLFNFYSPFRSSQT